MSYLPFAFLMGLLGSVHCAVMCGPIVLGLPFSKQASWQSVLQVLLYQLGRVAVYVILGAIVGAIGGSIALLAKQEIVSLMIGISIVFFAILQLSGKYVAHIQRWQVKLVAPLSKLMGKMLKLPIWGLAAGMLNGLIPCGMVYLALATSLNQANYKSGAYFMLLFGLGTTPLMFFISIGGVYLRKYLKFNTQQFLPWFALFIGVLFVLRSANLNIPFLSPAIHNHYGTVEKCG